MTDFGFAIIVIAAGFGAYFLACLIDSFRYRNSPYQPGKIIDVEKP